MAPYVSEIGPKVSVLRSSPSIADFTSQTTVVSVNFSNRSIYLNVKNGRATP